MIKTLVFLAVAYGLRALVQPHRSSAIWGKTRPAGQKILYFLAALGAAALGGILFLIFQSLQVSPEDYHSLPSSGLLAQKRLLTPLLSEAAKPPELPPAPALEPGTKPPYVLLFANEAEKTSGVDKEKPRSRVRPRPEKKPDARSKPLKKQ